jgi:hypothetical protein
MPAVLPWIYGAYTVAITQLIEFCYTYSAYYLVISKHISAVAMSLSVSYLDVSIYMVNSGGMIAILPYF